MSKEATAKALLIGFILVAMIPFLSLLSDDCVRAWIMVHTGDTTFTEALWYEVACG